MVDAVIILAGRSMITLLSDQLPVLFTDPNRQLPELDIVPMHTSTRSCPCVNPLPMVRWLAEAGNRDNG